MDTLELVVNIEDKGTINITPVIETVNLDVKIGINAEGGEMQIATAAEYTAFKRDMETKIDNILNAQE